MLRRALMEKQGDVDSEGFRLRGTEVTRLEGLADGIFALALALLILSAEVPKTFGELLESIKGLPVFAICFATIMWFWSEHYKISRRYGLVDKTSMVLTSLFLFVVLFYVYPLKFVFTLFIGGVFFGTISTSAGVPMISDTQVPQLYLLYGIGGGSVALVFLLMHRHALRSREKLELTPIEVVMVRGEVAKCLGLIAISAGSITLAYLLPPSLLAVPGMFYSLTAVSEGGFGWYFGAKVARMQRAAAATQQSS